MKETKETTERFELALSWLLRAGVAISFVLIGGGLILAFVRHPAYLHATNLGGLIEPGAFSRVSDIGLALERLDGEGFIMLGCMVLLSTPILRVFVSIGLFAVEKSWGFVVMTSVVFLLLMTSLILGKAGG